MAREVPDLDRALRAFDAASFVRRHGGRKESLSPASHEYLLDCPKCGSSRLRWNVAKNAWVCWGHPTRQGSSGNTLDLICALEDVDELAAIGIVLDGYVGGDAKIEALSGGLLETPRRGIRRLPPIQWPAGVDRLTEPCEPHRRAWDYLASRGVTSQQVRDYQIGYGRSGRLESYIVFPVFMDRAMVFWQARATFDPPASLTSDAKRNWVALTGYRKTLNPTSIGQNATGSEVIFNLDRASTYETIVICEGPFDAVKTGSNAVALLGKVAQPVKVQRLIRTSARAFIVYLDRGEEERKSALALARELTPYASVWIATPPEGYDPGSLTLEQNAHILSQAVLYEPGKLGLG